MPGSRIETKTLERIVAIAKAISGIGASRVDTGLVPVSDAEDFEAKVKLLKAESQGYFWVALKSVRCVQRGVQHNIDFYAELVVPVAKETSTSLVTAWEFALSLRDALELSSNYSAGEVPPAVSVGLRHVRPLKGGWYAIFDFGGHGDGQMTAVDP